MNSCTSMYKNIAITHTHGIRVWIREQQKEIKGTTEPLMANLDITHYWSIDILSYTCDAEIDTTCYTICRFTSSIWHVKKCTHEVVDSNL